MSLHIDYSKVMKDPEMPKLESKDEESKTNADVKTMAKIYEYLRNNYIQSKMKTIDWTEISIIFKVKEIHIYLNKFKEYKIIEECDLFKYGLTTDYAINWLKYLNKESMPQANKPVSSDFEMVGKVYQYLVNNFKGGEIVDILSAVDMGDGTWKPIQQLLDLKILIESGYEVNKFFLEPNTKEIFSKYLVKHTTFGKITSINPK